MRARAEHVLPFTLLLPSVAFLALLIVIPMFQALLLAFVAEKGGFTLEHFQQMFGDVNFGDAWRNTLLLLLLIVPLQLVLALAMALLVNSRFRGYGFFLYIYAIPLAISDLAAGLLLSAPFTRPGHIHTGPQSASVRYQPILFLSVENF